MEYGDKLRILGLATLVGFGSIACGASVSQETNPPQFHNAPQTAETVPLTAETASFANPLITYSNGIRTIDYGNSYSEVQKCDGADLVTQTNEIVGGQWSSVINRYALHPACADLILTSSDFPKPIR